MSQLLSSNAIFASLPRLTPSPHSLASLPRLTPSPHSLASLPRLNLSTHRAEPVRVYFSLPTCLKLGVSEGRLDGISFELGFSDLFVLFSKLFFKVTSGNKEIRSGGLWFSYKYIAVSKHTRNERNLFHERNRPDRSYEERRALSGKFTVKFP